MSTQGVGLGCQRLLETLAIWEYFIGSGSLSPLPPPAMTAFGNWPYNGIVVNKEVHCGVESAPAISQVNASYSDPHVYSWRDL